MSVARVCSRDVDTAETGESVQTAALRMHARKVGTLVVIDARRQPIGMITDRDPVMRVLAAGRDPALTNVRDVMTAHPALIHDTAPIEEALRAMRAHQCRRIPVVDDLGKLSGVVSVDDILQTLMKEFHLIGRLIHAESPQSLAEE